MKFKQYIDKKIEMCDIFFIKISVIAFTLMIAKLWQPILNLEWYWYGIIFVIFAIKPMIKIFK
jgi:arginine exporter protein ArgO